MSESVYMCTCLVLFNTNVTLYTSLSFSSLRYTVVLKDIINYYLLHADLSVSTRFPRETSVTLFNIAISCCVAKRHDLITNFAKSLNFYTRLLSM